MNMQMNLSLLHYCVTEPPPPKKNSFHCRLMHIPSITTEPYSKKCDFFYSQSLFLFHQALMFRTGHGKPFISYHTNRCRNKKKKT